jgi:glutamate 5-kinase
MTTQDEWQEPTSAARRTYRRIVAKFGTNLLTAGTDRLDLEVMAALVGQVARLMRQGLQVAVVTSGAIAAGRHRLGVANRRRDIPFRQILAAVGQSHLMHSYDQLFRWHGLVVAQVLLTKGDIADREGYLNVRNTLMGMLEMGVVPIINENDVVSLDEVAEAKIGENDNLAALVANLIEADLLVILTNTDGLYTADPTVDPTARLIPRVDRIDEAIERLAGGTRSPRSRGGMKTKLQAARLACASGTDVVIANGHTPQVLNRVVTGEPLGTLFPATVDRLESRKRWMRSGLAARGCIVVDAGAVRALREQGTSLLPAGVLGASGPFQRGDIVTITDAAGEQIAYGIANYSDADINRIKGHRSDRIVDILGYGYGAEVVHRNNLVLL